MQKTKIGEEIMDIILNQYTIDIPKTDLSFFSKLVKKMGWKAHFTSSSVVKTEETKVTSEKHLSPRLEWLRQHPVKLSDDDLSDERTQYILNK